MGSMLRRSLHAGLSLGVVALAVRLGASVAFIPTGGAALEGCSITSTDGGILLKSQTKYTAGSVSKQSTGTYNGEAVHVTNQNGDVTVNGDPNATTVRVTTTPFAFADNSTDGDAAIADVQSSIKIDQSQAGVITVSCSEAAHSHGSAGNGTTGCDGFTVTVPAGTAQAPIVLTAAASNGQLTVAGVDGSVQADASNGAVQASVTPEKGSTVEVSSGNGDVTLSLPAGFACDSLSLQASGPGANVSVSPGFVAQVTASSTSVGTAGTGAASVKVSTDNGSITLQPQ